jgi:2-C-methyl-D-erythritol 4-phosphate cytidylyltransferase
MIPGRRSVRACAIVVAAGRGNRLGAPTAKAFLPVGGRPLVIYSLKTLAQCPTVAAIVLVVAPECIAVAQETLSHYGPWPVPVKVVSGGAERQDSVRAGIDAADEATELILVHDAARPFVSPACVTACMEAAADHGAAIAAVPARDSVKMVAADRVITQTLDRQLVWLAQTPQAFRAGVLRQAHRQASRDGYSATDDAALVERLGVTVRVVLGEATNLKVTTPEDLAWAEWYVVTQSRRE